MVISWDSIDEHVDDNDDFPISMDGFSWGKSTQNHGSFTIQYGGVPVSIVPSSNSMIIHS